MTKVRQNNKKKTFNQDCHASRDCKQRICFDTLILTIFRVFLSDFVGTDEKNNKSTTKKIVAEKKKWFRRQKVQHFAVLSPTVNSA
jgi:hypothetical protein